MQRAILARGPVPFSERRRFDRAVQQLDQVEQGLKAGNGELGIAPLAALAWLAVTAAGALFAVFTVQASKAGDELREAAVKGLKDTGEKISTVTVWVLALWGLGLARKSWTGKGGRSRSRGKPALRKVA